MLDTPKLIVLAGGYGKRINSTFPDCPKPLIPINQRRLLDWVLDPWRNKVDTIDLLVSHLGHQFEEVYGGCGYQGKYRFFYDKQPGLGRLSAVSDYLKKDLPKNGIFIINGDTFVSGRWIKMLTPGLYSKLLIMPSTDFFSGHKVLLKNRKIQFKLNQSNDGRRPNFIYKNTGVMYLNSAATAHLAEMKSDADLELRLNDVLNMSKFRIIRATHNSVFDVGTPRQFNIFQNYINGHQE